jgi:hypothetical protein
MYCGAAIGPQNTNRSPSLRFNPSYLTNALYYAMMAFRCDWLVRQFAPSVCSSVAPDAGG